MTPPSTSTATAAMLDPTDEQLDFASTVRRALEAVAGVDRTRRHATSHDPQAWRSLSELGLAALTIPEQYDGAGAGLAEMVLAAEELGAVLYNGPFLSSAVLASVLLRELGGSAAAEVLPALASGQRTAAVLIGDLASTDPGPAQSVNAKDGRLTGTIRVALNADADVLLIVANDGVAYLFEQGAPGFAAQRLTTVDPLLPLHRVELRDVAAKRLDGNASRALRTAVAYASVALSAMQVGGAERCLRMSVDYAKTRVQFGRLIGEFQAIKHKCADQLIQVESARSAAHHAAAATEAELPSNPRSAIIARSLASTQCSDAFVFCAAENIQIHGGMGFTWEHDAHLYFKRAHTTARLLGDPAAHRQVIAGELELLGECR